MNKILASLLFLISIVSLYAMEQPKDFSYVLAIPFEAEKYDAYASFISNPSVKFACPLMPHEEACYANMLLVKQVKILEETKQITPLLFGLVQRCAVLASVPFHDEWVSRFQSMFYFLVNTVAGLKIENCIAPKSREFAQENSEKEKWFQAAHVWKSLHEQALLNLGAVREQNDQEVSQKQHEIYLLESKNKLLSAHNADLSDKLTQIGCKLYESERRKQGSEAMNAFLEQRLIKAQEECEQAKKDAHKKSCEIGRLKSKLKALQKASK